MEPTLVDSFMAVPKECPCCGKKLKTERFEADPECGVMNGYDWWECSDCELCWEAPLRKWSRNDE